MRPSARRACARRSAADLVGLFQEVVAEGNSLSAGGVVAAPSPYAMAAGTEGVCMVRTGMAKRQSAIRTELALYEESDIDSGCA